MGSYSQKNVLLSVKAALKKNKKTTTKQQKQFIIFGHILECIAAATMHMDVPILSTCSLWVSAFRMFIVEAYWRLASNENIYLRMLTKKFQIVWHYNFISSYKDVINSKLSK